MQIAWLTNAPSGDQVDLLKALASRPEIDLTVFYCSRSSEKGAVNFLAPDGHGVALKGVTLPGPGGGVFLNPSIVSLLIKSSYDLLVVGGYIHPTMQLAMFLRSVQRKPWVLFAERPGLNGRKGWSRTLRGFPMRMVRSADAIIATGRMAQRAYESKFGPSKTVFTVPYLIDPAPFLQIERRALSTASNVSFLACGSLIARKGLDVLINAFARMAHSLPQIKLMIVGDGPDRNVLEARVPHEIRDRIIFKGSVPFADRASAFAEANVFIHPARHDGWGVVIQEALAAGMPVIATKETGAAHDLIEEGRNGFLIDAEDEFSLAERIAWFANHQEQIEIFGARARATVAALTPEWGAAEFVKIATTVLRARGARNK